MIRSFNLINILHSSHFLTATMFTTNEVNNTARLLMTKPSKMIRIVKADVQNQSYLPENQPVIVRLDASSQEDTALMPITSYALATYTKRVTAMVVKVRSQGFSGFEIEAGNKTAWVSLDILHDFGHPFLNFESFLLGTISRLFNGRHFGAFVQ